MTIPSPPGSPGNPSAGGTQPTAMTCVWHPDRVTALSCSRCGRPACPECLMPAAVGFHCKACVAEARSAQRAAAPRTITGARTVAGAIHGRKPLVTYVLIGINLAVYVLVGIQAGSLDSLWRSKVYNAFTLTPMYVAGGEWWRVVTSGFLHLSSTHIALNMLALYFIGVGLERVLGQWRYIVLYLLSLLGGSAAVMWFAPVNSGAAGASGAIFGLMGALLVTLKRLKLNLRQAGIIIGINVVATFIIPNISWQAHLGGLVVGALVGAAMVYAPAAKRFHWQVGVVIGMTIFLVGIIVTRDMMIGPVDCFGTFSTGGTCRGEGLG